MPNVLPFKMYTIEEVYNEMPKELRPTSKTKFEELIEKHGLYREISPGRRFMLDSDIDALFELARARPREADLRGGPARLIAGERSPNELGYLVVLGDALDRDAALFIGWAPRDGNGIGDLKQLVQYGYPDKIDTLSFTAATPAEVADVRKKLASSSIGVNGWFRRSEQVNSFLVALRTQGTSDVDLDEEGDGENVVNIGESNG